VAAGRTVLQHNSCMPPLPEQADQTGARKTINGEARLQDI
jgi:hypothetical protein